MSLGMKIALVIVALAAASVVLAAPILKDATSLLDRSSPVPAVLQTQPGKLDNTGGALHSALSARGVGKAQELADSTGNTLAKRVSWHFVEKAFDLPWGIEPSTSPELLPIWLAVHDPKSIKTPLTNFDPSATHAQLNSVITRSEKFRPKPAAPGSVKATINLELRKKLQDQKDRDQERFSASYGQRMVQEPVPLERGGKITRKVIVDALPTRDLRKSPLGRTKAKHFKWEVRLQQPIKAKKVTKHVASTSAAPQSPKSSDADVNVAVKLDKRSGWDFFKSFCFSCGGKASSTVEAAPLPRPRRAMRSILDVTSPSPFVVGSGPLSPQAKAEVKTASTESDSATPAVHWSEKAGFEDEVLIKLRNRLKTQTISDSERFNRSFDQRQLRELVPLNRGGELAEEVPQKSKARGRSRLRKVKYNQEQHTRTAENVLLATTSKEIPNLHPLNGFEPKQSVILSREQLLPQRPRGLVKGKASEHKRKH